MSKSLWTLCLSHLVPPALGKYWLNKWMNKWMHVIHRGYEDKWHMVPAPWGAHSLSNTGSKLNTGSASWVAHSFIQKHHFICVELLFTSQPRWNDKLRKHNMPWRSPEWGQGRQATHPDEAAFSCWGSVLSRRKGGTAYQSCGSRGSLTQNRPEGPIRKAERESLTRHSIWLCVHWLQRGRIIMALWAVAWAGTGRADTRIQFCFLKEIWRRPWF